MKGVGKVLILAAVVAVVVVAGILVSYQGILTGTGLVSSEKTAAPIEQAIEDIETASDGSAPDEQMEVTAEATAEVTPAGQASGPKEFVIEMSSSGFIPSAVTISKGDTVRFVTVDSGSYWPASAMHPTHTVYPGSAITKCGTGADIFDACRGMGQGESFSFTFDEVGKWGFHDHLHSNKFGSVTVQ